MKRSSSSLAIHRTKWFWIVSGTSIAALLGAYVLQVNMLTATAYEISSTRQGVKQVLEEKSSLETAYLKSFSVRNMEQLAQQKGFERIGTVRYVQVVQPAVAQRTF